MCITRPLHIVSHPPTQRTTCWWVTPKVKTITMTSLPVANNVHYTHYIFTLYIHKHFLCHLINLQKKNHISGVKVVVVGHALNV